MLLWKRNSLLLIFLLLSLTGITAQSITIKGKVVAAANDVTGVAVQNLSTRRATITDFEGNFSIRGSVGDTLVFSAVQFKNKILPITQAISTTSFVLVPLEPFVNELREVVVQPYGLSGDLNKDLGGLAVQEAVDEKALGLPNAGKPHPTQSERLLAEANGGAWSLGAGAIGAGTGVPLNPIIKPFCMNG